MTDRLVVLQTFGGYDHGAIASIRGFPIADHISDLGNSRNCATGS